MDTIDDLFEHYNQQGPIHLSEEEYKQMIAKLSDTIGALIAMHNEGTVKLLQIIMNLDIDRENLLRIYLDAYKGTEMNTEALVEALFGKVDLDGDSDGDSDELEVPE